VGSRRSIANVLRPHRGDSLLREALAPQPEPHETELRRDELVRDAQQLLALIAALEEPPERLRRVLQARLHDGS
jgi:hypothetical protein